MKCYRVSEEWFKKNGKLQVDIDGETIPVSVDQRVKEGEEYVDEPCTGND